ncbi:hypothetical protein [Roseateles sp. P5_E8]
MRTIAFAALASLLVFACAIAAGYLWWAQPTVSIERQGVRSVVVHTELLGDYPSNVGSIQIKEAASEKTVWSALPEGEMVQIHSFVLRAGTNDWRPSVFWGRFRPASTGEAATFSLDSGVRYIVRVCAPTVFPLCRSETFVFDE